ncbi:helicase associated domain-containing protein [Streptomyces sp. NPDC048611]|uniref:helicase associated domain-containing protein n=1 Tax=Streptomyces sp. NPDC048611 TaxID=3155635 RepID=UPI00341E2E1F
MGSLELPDAPAVPAVGNRLLARERAFQRGLAAARAFREREGHLDVPQRHIEEVEGDPVRLGQWLATSAAAVRGLSPNRQEALAELGL